MAVTRRTGPFQVIDLEECTFMSSRCVACGGPATHRKVVSGRVKPLCGPCLSDPRKWVGPRWAGGLWPAPDPWLWRLGFCTLAASVALFAAGYFTCLLTR